jgi:ATP-dependent helicase HepA
MTTATSGPLRVGDLIVHRFNPDLGPGRVESFAGRHVIVAFPKTQARLTLAAADAALVPLRLHPGTRVRVEKTGGEARIAARLDPTSAGERPLYRLDDGVVVAAPEIWPLEAPADPVERLKALDADGLGHFRNRLDGLRLERTRQARGLGSFLGGRIALYPHQLHVAERATARDPVRWLLADEVGLGKTVEACLILSRLLRTERADRALVVAPATLTVQWLGELYRKFHQTFVLLDAKRRADVAREMGPGFNPFDAHRRAVVALEDLAADPRLAAAGARAGTDLLVIDEAHRLERRRGGAGNPAYRAVAPLARASEHVLLLSATPLEADTHGFLRLLELLRPEAYTSEDEFTAALAAGRPLPPCTSATRRADMGGIPPRVPLPVGVHDEEERVAWLALQARRWAPRSGLPGAPDSLRRARRGGSGGRDHGVPPLDDDEGKALVFCHALPTLTALKARLEADTGRRVAIFHEELTPERGDLEVADFRRPEGPTLLLSTECGGEGRNFEFCRRLVLFDLPRDPAQVEQRIGRLDRVTRRRPIEIVYFRPAAGFEAELVRLYEDIGLFRQPLGGLERSLRDVELEIRKTEKGWGAGRRLAHAALVAEVRAAVEARERAVYHHLHADGYHEGLAAGILSRVPPELDAQMERFVIDACDLFGFDRAEKAGQRAWCVEFGSGALVDGLPGVSGGTRFLGTFDRDEAVAREELEFFASGHPLVEALFGELHDGPRGRVALFELPGAGRRGLGLLAIGSISGRPPHGAVPLVAHEPDGPLVALLVDLDGQVRPEWARLVLAQAGKLRPLAREDWLAGLADAGVVEDEHGWPDLCQSRLAGAAGALQRLEAVAAVRLLR